MSTRGLTPVLGVVLLIGLTVVLAASLGAVAMTVTPQEPAPVASVDLEADAATDEVTVRHTGGETLDPERLTVRLAIDGDELEKQPPIPFFSVEGFAPGPTGPFNARWEGEWTTGETASVRISGTNVPEQIDSGERVEVTITAEDHVIVEEETIAQ